MDRVQTKLTEQMINYFEERTRQHVDRVVSNLLKMVGYRNYDYQTLLQRGKIHDLSKLSPPEREGYIWHTWWHYCKKQGKPFELPTEVEPLVKLAIDHHITTNSHHAQSHKNPNEMPQLDMIQMVCDWTAMSQEYGEKSCKKWVDSSIDRYNFSQETTLHIYAIIKELDERLAKQNV